MALSQDFEARRRQRLKEQHRKREQMRKIRRIIFLLAAIALIVIVISNIVRCATKPSTNNQAVATQLPYKTEEPKDAVYTDAIPEPKAGANNFLDILKNSGQTKHVYLTFEGGPSKTVTPAILDTLRKYNVKATFFMTGDEIKASPYLCTRAMEEGHLVLPLSKSGNADILYADKTTFMDEVEETYKLITDNSPSSAKPIKIYRFLNGSNYSAVTQEYKDELAKAGYYYCDWNTSIGDSDTNKTSEQLLTYFTGNKPSLNNLVIQMHNTDKNTATAEMLGDMIAWLLDDGYTIKRLDDVDTNNASKNDNDDKKSQSTEQPTSKPDDKSTQKPADNKQTQSPKSTNAPQSTKATVTEAPKTATVPPTKKTEKPSKVEEIESE